MIAEIDEVQREVFPDHEVMHPPHRLAHAISLTGAPAAIDIEAITRAEVALAELSAEFSDWMKIEIDALETTRSAAHRQGFDAVARTDLFRAAHDIKGGGATFGFPIAGRIAGGLCLLIETAGEEGALSLTLVDRHVDAIAAIVRQEVHSEDDPTALALADRLDELVGEAVAKGWRAD